MSLQEMRWATMRLLFYTYLGFCLVSVVGGFLTFPIFSRTAFGSWRFWRYIESSPRLYLHGWKMSTLLLFGQNEGFMMSVPLRAPPHSSPPRELTVISPAWESGNSCGNCDLCCTKIKCPILDKKTGLCRGYDSFFWRYFNCGRFPSAEREIQYYGCEKWVMKPIGRKQFEGDSTGDLLGGDEPVTAID